MVFSAEDKMLIKNSVLLKGFSGHRLLHEFLRTNGLVVLLRRWSEAAVNFCLGWGQQSVIDKAIDKQWQPRLRACFHASGQHFEQLINWNNCLSVERFCFYKYTFSCKIRI